MKKSVLITALMLCLYSFSEAQTFTVANSDGVEISYSVVNDNCVRVMGNVYSGRVVVPESVTYEGTTYTVTQVANQAFMNCSVTYVELPSTLENVGIRVFFGSTLDTLYLKCPNPPGNLYGNELSEEAVKNLFGSAHFDTITIIVPANQLQIYRYSIWGLAPYLTAPGAVPVTLYAPKDAMLVIGNKTLKAYNKPASYYTRFFEIGERSWIAVYNDNSFDTMFMGWDKGDVFLTEITQADTLRPVYARVAYGTLNSNNISTLVRFNGQLSYMNGSTNFFVPSGSDKSTIFCSGLWIAGEGTYDCRISAQRFSPGDFVPGPLTVDGQWNSDLETRKKFNRVWTVSRADIDNFIANVGTDGYSIPEDILTWPGNGDEGYAQQLAPYYDADSDGVYNPHHGDYPIIRGDRMIFGIFNDRCIHSEAGSYPLGIEVHMSAYAFDEPSDSALNNTVFVSYKIFNRSTDNYQYCRIAAFTDFDLGSSDDDYIGCDVKNGMAYCYNGQNSDQTYGDNPPVQGSILLAGPYADSDGLDNPKIDMQKMQDYFPEQLATYLLPDGSYDIPRLTADADLYYPDAWQFTLYGSNYYNNNSSINGMNYGNGIVDDERMGMSSFLYYNNSNDAITGDPQNFTGYWNYINGAWRNGDPFKYGGDACHSWSGATDLYCSFMYPGDSDPLHYGTHGFAPDSSVAFWTEFTAGNTPGDRRGVQCTGFFTMEASEVNTLDMAYNTLFGNTEPWASVQLLSEQAQVIRRQFAHDTTDSGRPFTYMPFSAPIADIAGTPSQPSMRLYPNPTRSRVTIALGEGAATDIQVYDMRGNRVMTVAKAQGTVSLDISSLPNGVYIVRCGTAVERLVKM